MDKQELRAAIAKARQGMSRRHPAEVTSDRLGDAVDKWYDHFTGEEKDMIAAIRHRLEEIAEEADDGRMRNTST